ncbi:hypothetical protein Dimus_020434 [Dionaea muscipula]
MTIIHLKKKDVVKSSVKGISIEFDHEQCVAILDVHWKKLECCEYIEEVWEESRRLVDTPRVMMRHMSYVISMKDHELPLWRLAHFGFEAFGVPLVIKKGEEPKKYDFFEDTFLTMCKLTRENGIWWIGSGENRRRDDDEAAPEEEAEEEEERNKDDFDWEAVIDEATVERESESDDQFYDAQVGEEEPVMKHSGTAVRLHLRLGERSRTLQESTPRFLLAEKLNF